MLIKIALVAALCLGVSSQRLEEQKIESYTPCKDDSDCNENAFCYGNDDTVKGKCKCKDGFELHRNRTSYVCLAAVNLGQACEENFQCQVIAGPLAICNNSKICECNPELAHGYKDGKCYKTVRLTEFCLTDPNCKLSDGSFGYCADGKCQCGRNKMPAPDLVTCIVAKNLGQRCHSDSDCSLIPNGVCAEVCKCGAEYSISRDGKECLKAASAFGEPCIEDGQCEKYLHGSICNVNCTCNVDYHPYGNKCTKSLRAGDTCKSDIDCIFDARLENNVKCTEGVCKCIYGPSEDFYGCKLESFALSLKPFALLYPIVIVLFLCLDM